MMARKEFNAMDELVEAAVETVNARLSADPNLLGLRHEWRKLYFPGVNSEQAAWRAKRRCSFPGCNATTVKSHVLQRTGPIKFISENNHVMAPNFDAKKGGGVRSVGWNDASVFPGFCGHHDTNLFKTFETRGGVATDEDLSLQVYRSYQRELLALKHGVEKQPELFKEICEINQNFLRTQILREIGLDNIMKFPHILKYKFSGGDWNSGEISEFFALRQETYKAVARIQHHMSEFIASPGASIKGVCVLGYDIPVSIPVAFSGVGLYYTGLVEDAKVLPVRRAHALFMICIPGVASTKIVVFGAGDEARELETFLNHKGVTLCCDSNKKRLALLDFVEQFMVGSTDHWFMRPSVWQALDEKTKGMLEGSMGEFQDSLMDQWMTPIFAKLRHELT
jgi:hypothetical protein